MEHILETIDRGIVLYNQYVGGYLLLFLLIPTGVFLIFKLRFINITKLRHIFQLLFGKHTSRDKGEIQPYKALTTALSGTIGTGNIVGVALAIYFGGPGAIFWMWITGFLGMIVKYTECTLSIKYRIIHQDNTVSGGPMYYMERGLKSTLGKYAHLLAVIFAGGTALCSLGTGNLAQSNSIADVLHTNYGIHNWISGLFMATLVLLVIIGGIKRIAQVTSRLVPIMGILYILATLLIVFSNITEVPQALGLIFHDAFTGTSATGGFIGAAFIMTLRYGVARGIFSNESGQGSAAIAFSAAQSKHPAQEGLIASLGPLFDTIIVCSLTALVIIITGEWKSGLQGVEMTVQSFSTGLRNIGIEQTGQHIVAGTLLLFAFSTMISWSYYGSRAIEYFLGRKSIRPYLYIYGLFVFLGSVWGIDLVWHFVDMTVTFMTIPNLIALILLAGVVQKETRNYFASLK